MTELPLSLNLTVYMLTTISLSVLGVLFLFISLTGTVRSGGRNRLFYTLFTGIVTLYTLCLWLPTTGRIPLLSELTWILITNILFYGLIFSYLLYINAGLGHKFRYGHLMMTAVVFLYLTLLYVLSQVLSGSGTLARLIRLPNWGSVTIATAAVFLVIRTVMAFCYQEEGKTGVLVSTLLYIIPTLTPIIVTGTIRGIHARTFTVYTLPLLIIWEFAKIFTAPVNRRSGDPVPLGRLRSQLSESQAEKEDLNGLLSQREKELGDYINMARKVRRGLLPGVIHPDDTWEAATFFSPARGERKSVFFDFYYSYGRQLKGLGLFETPVELTGALYTAQLKKEWKEAFDTTASLASLYRRIDLRLKDIFGEGHMTGSVIRFEKDKIEYTGFGNPKIHYVNGRLRKSAPLIQDKCATPDDMKSYTMACSSGDALLLCNDLFLNKPAPVTGIPFGKERVNDVLEQVKGKSTDIVSELIDARNKHMGKKDEEGILLIYLRKNMA